MSLRRAHLQQWKDEHDRLEESEAVQILREWRAALPWYRKLRNWLRHPWANTRYWFWTHTPHLPRWEDDTVYIGPAGFDDDDWLSMLPGRSCSRCGYSEHGEWVHREGA